MVIIGELNMPEPTVVNPRSVKHGLLMFRAFSEVARRRRTSVAEIQDQPRVKFTKPELEEVATVQGRPFGRNLISNRFVNESIGLALGGDKLAAVLLRHNILKQHGLQGVIHGNKPAEIDLSPLYMKYLGSAKDMEAKLISLDIYHSVKPEDIANKESFDMGDSLEASFKTDDSKEHLLVTAPAILADDSSSKVKRTPFENVESPVEVKGLILQGKDGGSKLQISTKVPFSGISTIVLPMLTSFDWIELVSLNIEYKDR